VQTRIVHFDGCRSWPTASQQLGQALSRVGRKDVPGPLVDVHSAADVDGSGVDADHNKICVASPAPRQ
jgi:hypothetical protein